MACGCRSVVAVDRSADRNSDREQIDAILRGVEEAWNKHDMHALANLFHEDGVWVLWTGHVWTGRKAIEEGYAEVHRTVFRNSTQRERLEELTFVGPDAAVVRYCATLTGDERAPEKLIRSRKILVVTRREGAGRLDGVKTRASRTVFLMHLPVRKRNGIQLEVKEVVRGKLWVIGAVSAVALIAAIYFARSFAPSARGLARRVGSPPSLLPPATPVAESTLSRVGTSHLRLRSPRCAN